MLHAIQMIYNAVKRLSELDSEGIPIEDVTDIFLSTVSEGDTGREVREIQYFLSYIADFEESMNHIAADGIFGPETHSAVVAFQKIYGLEPNGIIDTVTWDAIYRAYRGIIAHLPSQYVAGAPFVYPGSPLRVGSEGESVVILQEYLNYISNVFTTIPKLTIDGFFGLQTERAVTIYQSIFSLDPTGRVSAATWNSIVSTYLDLYQGSQTADGQFPGNIQ
jgi:Putative peptidoglycan-binding domain-containing protein